MTATTPPAGDWTQIHTAPNGVETWERQPPPPKFEWRRLAAQRASRDPDRPAQPEWGADRALPACAREQCQHYDGKRCELLGFQPSEICEPVTRSMAALLDMAMAARSQP